MKREDVFILFVRMFSLCLISDFGTRATEFCMEFCIVAVLGIYLNS